MNFQVRVCFTAEKEPDFLSKKIMEKYGTDYSHVLIQFMDESDGMVVFHATGEGVHTLRNSQVVDYFDTRKIVALGDITLKVSRDFFLGYVKGACGKEYSQSQIAAIAAGRIQKNGDEKMICSEVVGLVIRDLAGIPLSGDQDGWTPYDIAKALDKFFNPNTQESL